MLEIGEGCGLKTLGEAYSNFMNHYDAFFLIDRFSEQHKEFIEELESYGLAKFDRENRKYSITNPDQTIEEALSKIK